MKFWLPALTVLLMSVSLGGYAMSPALEKIHRGIATRYQGICHIAAAQLASLDRNRIVLFDVRTRKEYNVGHLQGAIHVEPGIDAEEFIERYAQRARGKTVVFYCSVGQRSSRLAARVSDLLANTARDSFNLKGGLFNWRNERRPMVIDNQTTPYIHPYNFFWGRLIEDRQAIRYQPQR